MNEWPPQQLSNGTDERYSSVLQNVHADFIGAFQDETTVQRKLLLCFASVGWLGNLLICYVIIVNKSMRTSLNFYLFSLAISDTLILLSFTYNTMYEICFPRTSDYRNFFSITKVVQSMASLASIFATVAITVDRYIAICRPFMGWRLFRKRRTIYIISAIWIGCFFYALGFRICTDIRRPTCSSINFLFELKFNITACFILPLAVIMVLYTLIGLKLKRSVRIPRIDCTQRYCLKRRSLTKGLNISVAVVVEFIFCWGPIYMVLLSYYLFKLEKSSLRSALLFCGVWTNIIFTTVNPLIYSVLSAEFRKTFKETLSSIYKRRHSEEKTQQREDSAFLKVEVE